MPMSRPTFRFRPVYLLLLLPLLLYGGARYYVGYRIDRFIERANAGDNRLSLVGYDYSVIPLSVTARGLRLEQERRGTRVAGTIDRLALRGLHPLSLLGSGPLHLREAIVSRAELRILRAAAPSPGSDTTSGNGFLIDRVALSETDVTYRDSSRTGRIAGLSFRLAPLRVPFTPSGMQVDTLGLDTVYLARAAGDRVRGVHLRYAENELRLEGISYRGQPDTDVAANRIYIGGLSTADIGDTILLDTISVAQLGGGARVPAEPRGQMSSYRPNLVRIDHLLSPDINLDVSGDYGQVSYRGRIATDDLRSGRTISLGGLRAEGEEIRYDTPKDAAIKLTDFSLRQGKLGLAPFATDPGPTEIDGENFLIQDGSRQLAAATVSYRSGGRGLTATGISLVGPRTTGQIGQVTVADIDRSLLLGELVLDTGPIAVNRARIELATASGRRYRLRFPEIGAAGVSGRDSLTVHDLKLAGAGARGYRSGGGEALAVAGVDLRVDSVPFPFQLERVGSATVALDSAVFTGEEGVTHHGLYGMSYAARTAELRFDSIVRRNRLSAAEVFRRRIQESVMNFSFDRIVARGLDYGLLLRRQAGADSLFAEDFRLRVVENLDLDLPGGKRMLPLQALRSVGWPIRIDGVRVRSTDIAYGVVDSVLDAKTIHFTDGTIELRGVDTRIDASDSIRATFAATFEQTSPMRAVFILPRDSTGRSATMRGQLADYDLSRINPLMRVAADAIIESGRVDSLVYDGILRREVVTGEAGFYYRNLDVKVTGSGAWIKNLLSGAVVNDRNVAGEDFRPGKIYYEHEPEKSFFNAYWQGIVTGLRSSVLSDIVLPEELD
jgi:hypothetical protein